MPIEAMRIAVGVVITAIAIAFYNIRDKKAQRNKGKDTDPDTGSPIKTGGKGVTGKTEKEEGKKETDRLVKAMLSHYVFWVLVFLALVTLGLAMISDGMWTAIQAHPIRWAGGILFITMGVVFRIKGNREIQDTKLPLGKGAIITEWVMYILGLILWTIVLTGSPIDGKVLIPAISLPKGTFGPGFKYYPEGQAPTTLGLATLGDGEGIKVVVHPGQASEKILIPEGMDWADEVIAGSPDINRILSSGTREEFCCVIKKDGLEKIIQDPLSLRALDRAGFLERELKGPKVKPVLLTYSLPQSARNSVTIHIIRRSQ